MLWKSKGLPDKSIKAPSTSDNSFNPFINYFDNTRIREKFDGSFLKVIFLHKQAVNIYIVYEINFQSFTVGQDYSQQRFFVSGG